MSGTPMLTVFQVDVKNQSVKDFGKRVAGIAKSNGGPKYLTYIPTAGDGPKDVVYIWFPDGPESAGATAHTNSDDAKALIDLAKKAKGSYKAFGKARLNRVSENGRVPGKPPAYLAVMGVKVDKAKAQAFKSGLKAVHQQVISKNKHIRYSALKLGDGKSGVVMYGMDSPDDLKSKHTESAKLDSTAAKAMTSKLAATAGAVKASAKMILQYKPEYSNP
jgi:hypothetical protein